MKAAASLVSVLIRYCISCSFCARFPLCFDHSCLVLSLSSLLQEAIGVIMRRSRFASLAISLVCFLFRILLTLIPFSGVVTHRHSRPRYSTVLAQCFLFPNIFLFLFAGEVYPPTQFNATLSQLLTAVFWIGVRGSSSIFDRVSLCFVSVFFACLLAGLIIFLIGDPIFAFLVCLPERNAGRGSETEGREDGEAFLQLQRSHHRYCIFRTEEKDQAQFQNSSPSSSSVLLVVVSFLLSPSIEQQGPCSCTAAIAC